MPADCSFLTALDLDGDVSFGDSDRALHGRSEGSDRRGWEGRPDAVVWPESTADVSTVLRAANERRVPVTPYAAGTGLEGHALSTHGGISLDMTRMDAVHEVRPGDLQVDVGPGVLGSEVDEAVERYGLFFPPLPSSGDISTIGGMVATDASGMKTVKYGEVADWVLALEAVRADGSVIRTGSRATKTSSGYNLTDLLVGSEGTLAVVTRVTLRLTGRPAQVRGGRAVFPDVEGAMAAVTDAVQSGVDVATLELIDETCARMANAYSATALPERPTLFLEFHANHAVDEEIAFCRGLFEEHGVETFEIAADDEMDNLWQARKDLSYAAVEYDPDREPLHPGDVTVPISALPDLLSFARDLAREASLSVPCFGHVGDGNVHYAVMVDPDDQSEVERAEDVSTRIVERAIDLGGTATGEHGIGQGKREFLVREHGEAAVETMRAVKRALDPHDTLNPGKVFPETADGERLWVDGDDGGD